jgi:chromosome partitioning protein
MSARIVAIANEKGGVGKTTTAVNLSVGLVNANKKVLLVDLDPQGSAGIHLGINGNNGNGHNNLNSTYHLLTGTKSIDDCKLRVKGIDFIPSSKKLAQFSFPFVFSCKKTDTPFDELITENMLKKSLDTLRDDYDYILIDCPPNWNILALNALVACTHVFIPLQTHFLAVKGMNNLLENIHKVRYNYNKQLNTVRILLCQYDARCNLSKEIASTIKTAFAKKMFNTIIRKNISLAESPMKGDDIFSYRHLSYGAEDYMKLVTEVIQEH